MGKTCRMGGKDERYEQSSGRNADRTIQLVTTKCRCEDNIKWIIKKWWQGSCLISSASAQNAASGR